MNSPATSSLTYTRPFLYAKQSDALFHGQRYGLTEASTKSGKTIAAIAWIIEQAFAGKAGMNYWWVAPVSSQAAIAYNRVKLGLPQGSFTARETPNQTITLLTGSVISFKSADNPDCFDAQTEVLTNKGWKFFSDLDKTEDILTLNPDTLTAEWMKPKRYIAQEYKGPMYRISSGKLDLLVTPNHRFFVKTRTTGNPRGRPIVENLKHKVSASREIARQKLIAKRLAAEKSSAYKFKSISEINTNHDCIPARVDWIGTDLEDASKDVCALLGIYIAEGCAAGSFGGTTALANGDYTVHFTQSGGIKGGIKGDVRNQMRDLFVRLGLNTIKETEDGFFIRSKQLWSFFSKLGNCYSKFIPERVKNLPPHKLEILLHWLLLGDGSIRQRDDSAVAEKVYYTTSRQLADDVQEIAIKAGYSAIIREKKQKVSILADGRTITPTTTLWQVCIVHSQFNYFADSKESYVSQEAYDGMVYCVETDNSTVLVRRNGRVCWSGNSLYGEDVYAAVVDEASRCKEESWHAVRSTLTATQGPANIIGNVKGRQNWFYHLARLAEKDGAAVNMHYSKITVLDAIAAGVIAPDEIEDARRTLPENVFRELYMAEPGDDTGNPFGLDHIAACLGQLSTQPAIAYGIDLAKKRDWFVVIGLDAEGAVCAFHRWQNIPWRESIRRVHEIVGEDIPALVDSTGIGDPVLEELQVEHGNFRGYIFSAASKQRLMEGLAVSIQGHELCVPDGPIRMELDSFEYELTRTGVRYTAPAGAHDDCVCSLALAREQWSTLAPAKNLMDYYLGEAQTSRAAAATLAEREFDETSRRITPFQPLRSDILDNELTELYLKTLEGYMPEDSHCLRCQKPIAGPTRVSDGVNAWHPECAG